VNIERIVGSLGIRLAAAGLALACLFGAWLYRDGAFPDASGWVLFLTIASGVLALMAGVHTSRAVYARWLAFSQRLHGFVVTVLFGACYLLVVPLFRLVGLTRDPLRLGRRDRAQTFWIPRQNPGPDSFERMG
jgi:hypothetical protein